MQKICDQIFRGQSHGCDSVYYVINNVDSIFTELVVATIVGGNKMASSPVDPLQTLHAALTAPSKLKEQADILAVLRETLENQSKTNTYSASTPLAMSRMLQILFSKDGF